MSPTCRGESTAHRGDCGAAGPRRSYLHFMERFADQPPLTPEMAPASPPSSRKGIIEWMRASCGLHRALIATLSLSSVVFAVWLAIAVHNAHSRLESQRASLIQSGTVAMGAQSAALLKLSALPLGWAMRAALLKDDFPTVDEYLQHMVREPHVTGAALIGLDGRVRLAANRKLEKTAVAQAFPGISIAAEQPAVVTTGADVHVVVPVMGLDRRLGTLVLGYEVPLPSEWGFASSRYDTSRKGPP